MDTQKGNTTDSLNLNFGLTIADLYRRDGLVKLDRFFFVFLSSSDDPLL